MAKTLISIRVTPPTIEKIKHLITVTGKNQTEVITKAIEDYYDKESERVENLITEMLFQYAEGLPEGEKRNIELSIGLNENNEKVFTLKSADDNERIYLAKVTEHGIHRIR